MAKSKTGIEQVMILKKVSEGSYRYTADRSNGPPNVRDMYLEKWAFQNPPDKIKVVVQPQ